MDNVTLYLDLIASYCIKHASPGDFLTAWNSNTNGPTRD